MTSARAASPQPARLAAVLSLWREPRQPRRTTKGRLRRRRILTLVSSLVRSHAGGGRSLLGGFDSPHRRLARRSAGAKVGALTTGGFDGVGFGGALTTGGFDGVAFGGALTTGGFDFETTGGLPAVAPGAKAGTLTTGGFAESPSAGRSPQVGSIRNDRRLARRSAAREGGRAHAVEARSVSRRARKKSGKRGRFQARVPRVTEGEHDGGGRRRGAERRRLRRTAWRRLSSHGRVPRAISPAHARRIPDATSESRSARRA